jgi:hypothetical protein
LSLECREADVENVQERLVSFLNAQFDPWGGEEKFDWLYRENPFGLARVWVLEDARGRLLGSSSAFPRRLRLGDVRWNGWVLGDFAVAKEHRAVGPAMALQRKVCETVDQGVVDLWYDFPSRSMMAIHGHMGVRQAGEMVRLVHLLRVDQVVERKVSDGFLGKSASKAGNALLELRNALLKRDTSITVSRYDRDFEESVPSGIEAGGGVSLDRSAAYLNWRHRRDPRGRAAILQAHCGTKPGGFIVFQPGAEDVEILDAFGISTEAIFRELVLEVIETARSRDASRVTVSLSDRHPLVPTLANLGFSRRDSVPFVVYAKPEVALETGWFLMSGDRD